LVQHLAVGVIATAAGNWRARIDPVLSECSASKYETDESNILRLNLIL